jgi:predicted transposase YdaD
MVGTLYQLGEAVAVLGRAQLFVERNCGLNALFLAVGKSFDSAFKILAEDDPRGLLFLFTGVSLTEDVTIEPLPREVNAPALQVDHVYRVRMGAREWIWHIEVQTHYKSDLPQRMLRYDLLLALKYPGVEIRSTLVILAERGTPRSVPTKAKVNLGGLRLQSRYQVIRMWKLDPKPALKSERTGLLPWVGLMKASPEEFLTALQRVEASGDSKLRAQAVLLGGLRYDREGIRKLLERISNMFITKEILRESSVSKDFIRELEEEAIASGMAKGMEEGVKHGVEQGRVDEARRVIRTFVSVRFPALGDLPELDHVADAGRLEEFMRDLFAADTADAAAAAASKFQA